MPPRTPLSTPLRGWRCPQCVHRQFTTTAPSLAVGPEHPRYVDVPQPPQQTVPDRELPKGRLPVPRDVFSGARGKDKSSEEWLHDHTQAPRREGKAAPAQGTREEWKGKMSEMRRRNLREGLAGLRARKDRDQRTRSEISARRQAEREEILSRPEREDERLTTPSHSFTLETLAKGPTREQREVEMEAILPFKRASLAARTSAAQADRLDHLHTLYLNAKTFIVTPQQLDRAVDEAFGTPEQPVTFSQYTFGEADKHASQSVWAQGRPERVQDMLNRASRQGGGRTALEGAGGFAGVNQERVRRIGEVLTGGKMEEEEAR